MSRQRRYLGVFCDLEDPQMASEGPVGDTRDLMLPRRRARRPNSAVRSALKPAPELALCPVEPELVHRLGLFGRGVLGIRRPRRVR